MSTDETLQFRRELCNLPSGAHLPGYTGHCPQYKYQAGLNFSKQTAELSKTTIHVHPKELIDLDAVVAPCNTLVPQPTGDNKYTSDMVPGYTGYVPCHMYKFGTTYRRECQECVVELVHKYRVYDARQREFLSEASSTVPLSAARSEAAVTAHLGEWKDRKEREVQRGAHRAFAEPPMPGYRGFVPGLARAENSLGLRFSVAAGRSLGRFVGGPEAGAEAEACRVFRQDGVLPHYSGFVPQRRYALGRTVGDQSRLLPACSHNFSCYGRLVDAVRATKTA